MPEQKVRKREPEDRVIALVGNPNVGKSTVFNALTGMNQHTGNWAGKTVSVAQGRYQYKGRGYVLADLPGTYSLLSCSEEEREAVRFLLSGQVDCTVVLCDATCLERTLNLALQIMQITDRVMICVNLMDEAKHRKIEPDLRELERQIGVPVVGTSAGSGQGLEELRETIRNYADGFLNSRPHRVLPPDLDLFADLSQRDSDLVSEILGKRAEEITAQVLPDGVQYHPSAADRFFMGRWTGRIAAAGLLVLVLWLTIQGANYPAVLLQRLFTGLEQMMRRWLQPLPTWLSSAFLDGIYAAVAQVVTVMLPPMAIFFPLFALLEDFGYLPRAAFLMDGSFQKCGGCGKQMLTMMMGFGCNAVGVTGCRIISSPRERILAIVTNAMVPCNGRFPAMIFLISMFFSENSLITALVLTGLMMLGIGMTFLSCKFLSKSLLNGTESHFLLELPPYRRPRIGKVLVRAMLDRTIYVLGRAVLVSAPAGLVIWLLQNVTIRGTVLLQAAAQVLEPVGVFLGMNGVILLAFILAFPANELVLPLITMILQGGSFSQSVSDVGRILFTNGWTKQTALCVLLFMLFHWPCGTTCLTIKRETGSWQWTLLSILLPLLIGILFCRLTVLIG